MGPSQSGQVVPQEPQFCGSIQLPARSSHAGPRPSASSSHPQTLCVLYKHLCSALLKGVRGSRGLQRAPNLCVMVWPVCPSWTRSAVSEAGSRPRCVGAERPAEANVWRFFPKFLLPEIRFPSWVHDKPPEHPMTTPQPQHPPHNWKPTVCWPPHRHGWPGPSDAPASTHGD